MFPNSVTLSSTLPRINKDNKEYDDNLANISKSLDCQNNHKSWPLVQVVECVTIKAVSNIPPPVKEMETDVVDGMSLPNKIDFKENFQSNCIDENILECSSSNNVLKIVLPLVNDNEPLNSPLDTYKQNILICQNDCKSSIKSVQYSQNHCNEKSVNVVDNVNNNDSSHFNNIKYSILDEAEINRFSSTFEDIKTLLKEGLVDGLDEMPPDFQPPNPPKLYRVSSLPSILSHDSTKNQHPYLTMYATKNELLINKLNKSSVEKQDMSIQVSTELFKIDNVEKVLVDTSCQTEDIFINIEVNTDLSTEQIDKEEIFPIKDEISLESAKVEEIHIVKEIDKNNAFLLKESQEHNLLLKEIEENNKLLKEVEENNLLYEKYLNNINLIDNNVNKEVLPQISEEINVVSKQDNQNNILSINEQNHGKIEDNVSYKNLNTLEKELELQSIEESCTNYINANILEEFVNEQLNLNNINGDLDFLFGPLPPSPVEESVPKLPKIKSMDVVLLERKTEVETTTVPFAMNFHKNESSNSIIKSRSIDAEFSQNFQHHQKIGTRSVQTERRTYPSELPITDEYPRPLPFRIGIHPSTIEKLSDISNSLPDTPLLGRCDFPRQYSATNTKTMSQMSNSLSINMRGAGHGSSIGLSHAMVGAELLHMNGPGRGWYPRQRQFRPVSVEQLDKLAASKSPVGNSHWSGGDRHKPVTLPPNLSPKFFNRSPREALRRVTSLLIRKGNTNKNSKTKTVFASSVIGPHGDISEECDTSQPKRGFFKSLWRK